MGESCGLLVKREIFLKGERVCVVAVRGAPPILTKGNRAHKLLVYCNISTRFSYHTYLTFHISVIMW
jgi:hypothetical protein